MHIPTVVKLLGKAGIMPYGLALELLKTSAIKTLNLNDDAYSFKVLQDELELYFDLYVSDDDGKDWQWIDRYV